MSEFIHIDVDPSHPFRKFPGHQRYGKYPLGSDNYGLDLDRKVHLGPRILHSMTAAEPELPVRLADSGLQAQDKENIWRPIKTFVSTHAVDLCLQEWASALDAAFSAPIRMHHAAFPFHDRPALHKWQRKGMPATRPPGIFSRLRPGHADRKRTWRKALAKTITIDWPKTATAPPRQGTELARGRAWHDPLQSRITGMDWHDPLRFGFRYDHDLNSHVVFIDGLRSAIPLGLSCSVEDNDLKVTETAGPLGGVRAYIGSVVLTVAELALRSAPRDTTVVVAATAGEEPLVLLSVDPEFREIGLMMLTQSWPTAGLGANDGFDWHF